MFLRLTAEFKGTKVGLAIVNTVVEPTTHISLVCELYYGLNDWLDCAKNPISEMFNVVELSAALLPLDELCADVQRCSWDWRF